MTSGTPAITLACRGPEYYSIIKMARARYETHDEVITCLSCLVVIEDNAP